MFTLGHNYGRYQYISFCIEIVRNILPCSGKFRLKKLIFIKDKLKRIGTNNILSNTAKKLCFGGIGGNLS